MCDVMITVSNIVNIIRERNKAQRHEKFIQLKDLEADYEDVPLFSKIRWLSAGKTLKHFFSLRKEIEATTKEYLIQVNNDKFIGSLAFLTVLVIT